VSDDLALAIPPELVEAIAERAAELLVEQLPAEVESWLGVKAAAEYLDCEPHRIYDLRRAGRLPCRKDGSRLLFRRSDLDAALDDG
jgi:excisionase family DNA binding protein